MDFHKFLFLGIRPCAVHVLLVCSWLVSRFLMTYLACFCIMFFLVLASILLIFIFASKFGSTMYLSFWVCLESVSMLTINGLAGLYFIGTLVSMMMYSP